MNYYKTNDLNVLNAFQKNHAAKLELQAAARLWAAQFDAEPAFYSTLDGARLVGSVRLNNYRSRPDAFRWTRPVEGLSRPVAASNKLVTDNKQEQQELIDRFEKTAPAVDHVSFEPVLASLGISSGDVLFCGFTCFELAGFLFIATGCTEIKNATEILGSEYAFADKKRAEQV